MISPDIKDLMRNMDSRYTLVVTVAKRARQLTGGAEPLTRFQSDKPVTLAIHEIAEGKVDYYRATSKQPEYGLTNIRTGDKKRGYMLYDETGDYDDEQGRETGAKNAMNSVFYDYSAADDESQDNEGMEDYRSEQ